MWGIFRNSREAVEFWLPARVGMCWTSGMETSEAITIVIFGVGLLILFMLLVSVWRVGGTLARLERRIAEMAEAEKARETAMAIPEGRGSREPDRSRDGAFLRFLEEDAGRRKLSKAEQFAQYRQWRKARGLNWMSAEHG